MKLFLSSISTILALLLLALPAIAQTDTLTKNSIIIDRADSSIVENINNEVTQFLYGDVSVYQDSVFLFCDHAILKSNVLTAAGNVGIVQADTINVYADSLIYYGDRKIGEFFNNVTLDHDDQKLYTDYLRYNVLTKTASFRDTALLTNGNTKMQSLKGTYKVNKKLASFREQVVVIDSSFNLRADSLDYLMDEKKVIFLCPTAIALDTADIYCEDGYYDMDDEYALFTGNPQYRKVDTKAVADTIFYDEDQSTIEMHGNAIYLDDDKEAIAEQIIFKEKTEEAILVGAASYQDSSYQVIGEYIFRSGSSGKLKVIGKSFISNPPMLITGDSLDYNEQSGQGLAIGDVAWRDTSANVTIYCDRADYNDQKENIKAVGYGRRPLMENVIDEDTLYLAADTLFSYKQVLLEPDLTIDTLLVDSLKSDSLTVPNIALDSTLTKSNLIESKVPLDSLKKSTVIDGNKKVRTPIDSLTTSLSAINKTDSIAIDSISSILSVSDSLTVVDSPPDTARIFAAYPDVKIYKSDMQAVCDSLIYNDLDSIFYLYKKPIMWSDSTQFLGDTINIHLKDKKIDKVKMLTNSFVITEVEEPAFDQIKGRNSTAFFVTGEIDHLTVIGNAEAIYYVKDDEDDSYIGMNNTVCSRMKFFFVNKELDRIDFYEQPTSVMTPIQEVDPATARLDKFRWLIDKRPLSLEDILIKNSRSKKPEKGIKSDKDAIAWFLKEVFFLI